jgi:hypothetical protein
MSLCTLSYRLGAEIGGDSSCEDDTNKGNNTIEKI